MSANEVLFPFPLSRFIVTLSNSPEVAPGKAFELAYTLSATNTLCQCNVLGGQGGDGQFLQHIIVDFGDQLGYTIT